MNLKAFSIRFLSVLLCAGLAFSCSRESDYIDLTGMAQGGTYYICYQQAEHISYKKDIDSIFAAIDNSISSYNPYSTVSRINRNEDMKVDSILSDLFRISEEIYEETGRLFDISSAPLFDFWGFGAAKDTLFLTMSNLEITDTVKQIKQYTGLHKFRIEDGIMIKPDPRAELNFNAIAQGYSCDLIAAFLDGKGVENYLIEVGGEIYCKGLNRKDEKWNIGIEKPVDGNMTQGQNIQEVIQVSDRGVVSSGNYRKFIYKDGVKFGHTIDPVSGWPVSNKMLSATVIAGTAAKADAFATYFMIIGFENALTLLNERSDLEGYLVYEDKEKPGGTGIAYSQGLEVISRSTAQAQE